MFNIYQKYTKMWVILLMLCSVSLQSCKDDDDGPVGPAVEAPRERQFVWEGLNSWYFWQADVPRLSNDFRQNTTDYSELLNGATDPEDLFYNDLLLNYPVTDRFSFIVDDYVELDNSFQGISTSYGYEFGLVRFSGSDNVFGWVKYVLPNSPAANAGIVRGDIFTGVNNTTLTINNFRDLLFGLESYTLTMAEIENGTIAPNGETISMTSVEITENPVFLQSTIDLANNKKVGYLVFNSFTSTFHSELNAVFADFSTQGITDLVLDLRYNGGGSVLTAQFLASMISEGNPSRVFGNINYNEKHSQFNSQLFFTNEVQLKDGDFQTIGTEPLNSLGLSTVYILVSGSTASASELVINSLDPFITVKLIGSTTVGKNVGSITLYDSPASDFLDKASLNTSHTWAMQPIVSQFANAVNDSDYTNGFVPGTEINELDFLGDFKPLGDTSEPFLAAALSDLCPSCRVAFPEASFDGSALEQVGESGSESPLYQDMYLNGLFD